MSATKEQIGDEDIPIPIETKSSGLRLISETALNDLHTRITAAERERDAYRKASVEDYAKRNAAEAERDAALARCAELEAKMQGTGWISVDERLPKEGICVLVAFNDTFRKCEVAYLSTNLSTNSGKIWKGGKYWLYESATHWMPLPEPPILGEKKED